MIETIFLSCMHINISVFLISRSKKKYGKNDGSDISESSEIFDMNLDGIHEHDREDIGDFDELDDYDEDDEFSEELIENDEIENKITVASSGLEEPTAVSLPSPLAPHLAIMTSLLPP